MRFYIEGETGFGDGGVTQADIAMREVIAPEPKPPEIDYDYMASTGLKRFVQVENIPIDNTGN